MRRFLPAVTAAAAIALPASAAAQAPPPPDPTAPSSSTETEPPAPQPAEPRLRVALRSGLRAHHRTYTVTRELVRVAGRASTAAAGETVSVELWRRGRLRAHHNVTVHRDGSFATRLRPRVAGRYHVRAVHSASDTVAAGKSKRVTFSALRGSARRGSHGVRVELLQRQLARLAYAVPRSGRFDDGTARAVLAYRKVNRMARTERANHTIFERLFLGRGGFRLRYPRAGKHVEADLSRQVVVLADRGRPWRIYHMSSGRPSLPTVTGTFRFYRKTPGFNSEGMYYSNYFIRGYAIHGYASVPRYNASHGCIRVPIPDARFIYNWIRLGDRIFVYGHA